MHAALNVSKVKEIHTHLFVNYLSGLVGLSFRKSFGLFAPLHQRVMKEGLQHTWRDKLKLLIKIE